VIPPLSDTAWTAEFAKYQQIPQYRELNAEMTLAGFKSIYWWEWSHRFLARLVGVAFAIPFFVFLFLRQIPRRLVVRCFGLLALGGLQGLVGWWMVSSGLSDRVSVAPERLAVHLTLALALFAGLIWCGLEAGNGKPRSADRGPWATGAAWLTALIFLQCLLGALVAGNDAGLIYNDWPLMNGRFFPDDYFGEGVWGTLAHSKGAVQLHHRLTAYTLAVLVLAYAVTASRSRLIQMEVRTLAYLLGAVTLFQFALGIVTLVNAAPVGLSIAHQITAAILLAVAVTMTWRARRL
jgi:cytochrome c oxidase assembly protein subunit 15